MERALKIAGIAKVCDSHSLRHAFAAHLFEHGTDVRIQKLLGHAKLETTTAYTKVAVIRQQQIQSPLDSLTCKTHSGASPHQIALPRSPVPVPKPVGRMQIDVRCRPGETAVADAKAMIFSSDRYVHLTGMVVREPSAGICHPGDSTAGELGKSTTLSRR